IERLPQRRLLLEQNTLEERSTAYGAISTQLGVLKNRIEALQSPGLFSGRTASVSDATAATASATAGAVQGTYTFAFQQLASSARIQGASGAGGGLSSTSDVSGVILASAGFPAAVTAGTFRVNGAAVSVETTDSLQDVFDKIATATGDEVTASYDPVTDTISLSGSGPITLGTATDTSNFLEVAKLHNNGTNSVTSAASLGSVKASSVLGSANLATAISFGAGDAGSFRINGVEINYSASDTVSDVLKRIGDSDAGVTASYDLIEDRFVLANKATGDVGIALEDVTGNFLEATRLTTGSLARGDDLLYTVNGGGQLRSRSNTITSTSSGLAGLSVTALEEGASTEVTVATDRTAIRKAITAFVDEYNRVQEKIASETKLTADGTGGVTAGVLASESDAEGIASSLRQLAYRSVAGLDGGLSHLESLGFKSNSDDDTLELEDPTLLDNALADKLSEVEKLWLDPTDGIVARMSAYLEKVNGENGTLQTKKEVLGKQSTGIDSQIQELERVVQANRDALTLSFVAMETAQQNLKQQLQYLTQRFGS
ncbi:MAG: flagellar filament capping protein FliD, partial [Limisphaerales bacterium]